MPRIDPVKLQSLRTSRGWAKQKLAEYSDVSDRTILTAENGSDVSWNTVNRIASALKVDPAAILVAPRSPVPALDDAAVAELSGAGTHGEAPCCAFLAGDLSVLATKRALVLPLDAKVHVSIGASANQTTVRALAPSLAGRWSDQPDFARNVERRLARLLASDLFRRHFPWCATGFDLLVASEVPPGTAIYEETALALALAIAIERYYERPAGRTQHLAAALLSAWYADVSWATLVACSGDPARSEDVILFDRRNDDGIDLIELFKGGTRDLERNVYPASEFWETKSLLFNPSQLSVWWGPALHANVDERSRFRGQIDVCARLPLAYVLDEMEQAIETGRDGEDLDRKIGVLMQIHQLVLTSAGLVDREAQDIIARVNGFPDVLGAKLACGRGRGALLVLTRKSTNTMFANQMAKHDLTRLEHFRCSVSVAHEH